MSFDGWSFTFFSRNESWSNKRCAWYFTHIPVFLLRLIRHMSVFLLQAGFEPRDLVFELSLYPLQMEFAWSSAHICHVMFKYFYFRWELTPTDPRWVGAWWVGFFISSILMFIFALPFIFFGAELPSEYVVLFKPVVGCKRSSLFTLVLISL